MLLFSYALCIIIYYALRDCQFDHAFSHTLVPSLQLEHMSIFFLPFKIAMRNFVYSPFFHISLKDLCFRSPSLCRASLSKQHGATKPSHVITGSCQRRQQWLASLPLNWYPLLVFL